MKFTRFMRKDNKTLLNVESLDIREPTRAVENNSTHAKTIVQDRKENQERMKNQKDTIAVNTTITPKPENREEHGKKGT